MHTVVHLVRGECALDFLNDFFVGRNLRKRQRLGGFSQPNEMFVQLEDASIVEPQSLPNRVAPLDRGIKRTDAGLVAMLKIAIDVD